MCMEKETIIEIGEVVGRVKEVETNKNRNCIWQIIRLGVSVDITKPLIKIFYVKEEDNQEEKIPIMIQYKTLPDFCYCCGCFKHQY